jgi:hypothetical protein
MKMRRRKAQNKKKERLARQAEATATERRGQKKSK